MQHCGGGPGPAVLDKLDGVQIGAHEALLNPDSCPQAPETNRTKTNPDQVDLFIVSSFTPPITTF
jgi:hypothetical protein